MVNQKTYNVIGVMSGTSLDGLDIALCTFKQEGNKWQYKIHKGITFKYSSEWKMRLSSSAVISGHELMLLHNDFGKLIGEKISQFLNDTNINVDFISSHGHTVFHQPQKGLTCQIGNGAVVSSLTGISTVCDFRTLDIALGGQGAPLVPAGDKYLFSEYKYCLNLGGFANISFDDDHGDRIAYDICPVNILLNHFAEEKGLNYDPEGELGKKGKASEELLLALNQLEYYKLSGPKSLGKEWVWDNLLPIIQSFNLPVEDKMRTIYQHVTSRIAGIFGHEQQGKILITGGGAFNSFLIDLLKNQIKLTIEIPDNNLINFKEALIFAFLGLLRYRNEINCLSSVTGAKRNSSGGVIYIG
jgi:anhydro-N-acetylmuramic acid kinase